MPFRLRIVVGIRQDVRRVERIDVAQRHEGEDLVEQLRAAALNAGLTKFSLMGISLGGSVAQQFAGTYPEMVDKLVLADCSPRYNDEARANWPVRAAAAVHGGNHERLRQIGRASCRERV